MEQVKGVTYSLESFLGPRISTEEVRFSQGEFCVSFAFILLCPFSVLRNHETKMKKKVTFSCIVKNKSRSDFWFVLLAGTRVAILVLLFLTSGFMQSCQAHCDYLN